MHLRGCACMNYACTNYSKKNVWDEVRLLKKYKKFYHMLPINDSHNGILKWAFQVRYCDSAGTSDYN